MKCEIQMAIHFKNLCFGYHHGTDCCMHAESPAIKDALNIIAGGEESRNMQVGTFVEVLRIIADKLDESLISERG